MTNDSIPRGRRNGVVQEIAGSKCMTAAMNKMLKNTDASHVNQLLGRIVAANPLHSPFIEESVGGLEQEEATALAAYVCFCINRGLSYEYLAECYNTIVKDSFREQLYFQRNRRYRYSTYAEVADSVYMNDVYMKRYMHGLAITTYLWPNHRSLQRFFRSEFPRNKTGRYLEIGPGHGVFFMNAIRDGAFSDYMGVDISPTSVSLTQDLLSSGYFGSFSKFDLACQDVFDLSSTDAQYDGIVMGEVLEHVEDPLELMHKIRSLSSAGAFIFITTAINAPAVDHIYLFDSPAAVSELVECAGFRVLRAETAPYLGLDLAESMEKKLPINIALVLEPLG